MKTIVSFENRSTIPSPRPSWGEGQGEGILVQKRGLLTPVLSSFGEERENAPTFAICLLKM